MKPNLTGFAESRERLRDAFGQEVTFLIPVPAAYDGPTDPQTGSPYDPWAPPSSGGGAPTEVVKTVSVVNRPLSGVRDDSEVTAIGRIASDDIAFILPYEEYAEIAEATHASYLDDRYKITEARDDAMGTVYRRKIIYATKG